MNNRKIFNALVGLIPKIYQGNSLEPRGHEMFFEFREPNVKLWLSHDQRLRFEEAVEFLLGHFPKVGRRTIEHQLRVLCCNAVSKKEGDGLVRELLLGLLSYLDAIQETHTTVYVQLSGVELVDEEWSFGPVRLLKGSHHDIKFNRMKIRLKNGSYPQPMPKDVVVAEVSVPGEADYAEAQAVIKTQEAADFLQFLSLPENLGCWSPDPDPFIITCGRPIESAEYLLWRFASHGEWVERSRILPSNSFGYSNLSLHEGLRSQYGRRGADELAKLLKEGSPSHFDQSLKTAIRWLAQGIREPDAARKYLSFYIAMESLFTRDNAESRNGEGFQNPIMHVAEAIPLFLGGCSSEKRKINEELKELSRTRNRIVHRGFYEFDYQDLTLLARYAWDACVEAVQRRPLYRCENAFYDALQACKYSTSADTLPRP